MLANLFAACLSLSTAELDPVPATEVRVNFTPESRDDYTWTIRAALEENLDQAELEALGAELGGKFSQLDADEDGRADELSATGVSDLHGLRRVVQGMVLANRPLHSALGRELAQLSVQGSLDPFLEEFAADVLIRRLDSTPWERTEAPGREAVGAMLEALGGAAKWAALSEVRTQTRLTVDFQGSQRIQERIHIRKFQPGSTRIQQLPEGPNQLLQELSPNAIVQSQGAMRTQYPLSDLARTWRSETACFARLTQGLASNGPLGARPDGERKLVVFDDNGDLARIELGENGRPRVLIQLSELPDKAGRTTITAWSEKAPFYAVGYSLEGRLSLTAEVTDVSLVGGSSHAETAHSPDERPQ